MAMSCVACEIKQDVEIRDFPYPLVYNSPHREKKVANMFALFSSQPSQIAMLQYGTNIIAENVTLGVRFTNVRPGIHIGNNVEFNTVDIAERSTMLNVLQCCQQQLNIYESRDDPVTIDVISIKWQTTMLF